MIPEDVIREVKAKGDCRTIFSHLAGRSFEKDREMVRCFLPGHDDTTASLSISKLFFNCFGCHVSGSCINAAQIAFGLDFPDAVRYVAKQCNVVVDGAAPSVVPVSRQTPTTPQRTGEEQESHLLAGMKKMLDRTSVGEVNGPKAIAAELACHLPGSRALQMCHERGLTTATITKFQLGFSDPNAKIGHSVVGGPEHAVRLGLIKINDEGHGARRRYPLNHRLTIPIKNALGHVVAFGARTVRLRNDPPETEAEKEYPKYKNSASSEFWSKSDCLYGIDLALPPITGSGVAVIVEGYFDVMHMHQAGFRNTVGFMSSSPTESQILMLFGVADSIILIPDTDDAGKKTGAKLLSTCSQMLSGSKNVFVANLPADVKDCADLLAAGRFDEMQAVIDSAKSLLNRHIIADLIYPQAMVFDIKRLTPELVKQCRQVGIGRARSEALRILTISIDQGLISEAHFADLLHAFQWKDDRKPCTTDKPKSPFSKYYIPPHKRKKP